MCYKDFLHKLTSYSDWVSGKSKSVEDIQTVNVQDTELVKENVKFLKASIEVHITEYKTYRFSVKCSGRRQPSRDYEGLFPVFGLKRCLFTVALALEALPYPVPSSHYP